MPHNTEYYWANKEKELARNAEYHRNNKDKVNRRVRNRRHRINQDWFDAKVAEQDNACALCHRKFTETPHIDHGHECCPPLRSCDKCRRGLLCEDCNLGLGRLKDSVQVLERAIKYVLKYKGIPQ